MAAPSLNTAKETVSSFGQYQLIEKIAQGGMAEIFLGEALDAEGVGRPVVIKRILPHIAANSEFVEMLVDEAKIAVMLSHGNIAQIYDLGKVLDDYFIVMEYVEGKTLSQIFKRLLSQGKKIPIPYAIYLAAEVANGLDYMHRKSDENGNPLHIVHRDISPQNVILSTSGTVKIIDFGIAKAKNKVSTTDSGIVKGKFAYMSPEHAEGLKLDHRSDIFSLGVILFELLTGTRLLKGKNNADTIKKVKRAKIPIPSDLRAEIPKALDQILLRALQKKRSRRYQTAHDLAQELTRFWLNSYPDFSPRQLIPFLQELFPEYAPVTEEEKGEKTPFGLGLEIKKSDDKDEGSDDDTRAEKSQVIQAKLNESELFDIPAKTVIDFEEKKKKKKVVEEPREVSSKIQIQKREKSDHRLLILSATLGSLLLLILGGPYVYNQLKSKKTIPVVTINKPEDVTLPPPSSDPSPSKKTPAPLLGQLLVQSTPPGAKIFLNDKDTGHTTPFQFNELKGGNKQQVGLHLDRYQFWKGESEIVAGQTSALSAVLKPNYGELSINSLPEGADVILNGEKIGTTPYRLTEQKPETKFEITLQLEGYESWSGKAKIFGGKTEVISTSLKKLPLAP